MEKRKWNLNPEVWGGLECTINRLEDRYQDQLALTGHYERKNDIEHFAALGITAIRYPILWERHEPEYPCQIDWSWTEKQLLSLQQKNITVIAGLLHHGSGPRFTHLLNPHFAEQLAAYALEVARKFPWITYYTPVNEPLTTARFSGLYGLWYPHHQNDRSFVRMVIHQVKGVILAMRAIRRVNPDAKLVQTEDLGKTHSTDTLTYQAEFENERRWLSFDLLHGKVTREHPLWNYLVSSGATEKELQFFLDHSCQADIAGWNYYVTSERFLDEHVSHYPNNPVGGNGQHSYVDIEAVRVSQQHGLQVLLQEAHARFHIPMSITEAHLCCTREEQMRWFMDIWNTCCSLRTQGIDMVSVTAWALLGAYDWCSLLTRNDEIYEGGIFEVSADSIRPTALSNLVTSLAKWGSYTHPLLARKGWWHRFNNITTDAPATAPRPLVIIESWKTENIFAEVCRQRNIDVVIFSHEWDQQLQDKICSLEPWAILNLTDDPSLSISFCRDRHIPHLFFSLLHNETSAMENYTQIVRIKPYVSVGKMGEPFVHGVLNLLIDGHPGIWEISANGQISKVQSPRVNYAGWYQRVKKKILHWTRGQRFSGALVDHIPQEEIIEK